MKDPIMVTLLGISSCIFWQSGGNTCIMHVIGIALTILAGVYTVSWAIILLKDGNRAGAFWAFLLALTSTATSLYYYYQHGFFP